MDILLQNKYDIRGFKISCAGVDDVLLEIHILHSLHVGSLCKAGQEAALPE